MARECNLSQILVQDTDSNKYDKLLQSYKYLEDLSEDTLWILYEPALANPSSSRPFEGFKKLHRDLYLRLKLRSLESRLSKQKGQLRDDRPQTALSTQSDFPPNHQASSNVDGSEIQTIKDRLFTLEQKFGMIAHLGTKVEHDISSFQKNLVK